MFTQYFSRYVLIGFINTFFHWGVFLIFAMGFELHQSISNAIAFSCAVVLSYVLNSTYNYRTNLSIGKFFRYFFCMGSLSFAIGFVAERLNFPYLFTLIFFSVISLVIGYILSYITLLEKDT